MVKGTNTGVYIYSYIRPLLHGLYMEKGIVPMGNITGYSQAITGRLNYCSYIKTSNLVIVDKELPLFEHKQTINSGIL